MSATRGPVEEPPTREELSPAQASQAADASSPLPVWSALSVGRGMAPRGARAFSPPPLPGSPASQAALAMASLGLAEPASTNTAPGAEAPPSGERAVEPGGLPPLAWRAPAGLPELGANALTLPSAPVLAEAIHQLVQESVSKAVERMASRTPAASSPEPPAAPPVDVTSDAFVRGLLGRLRVLLQEERFRDGLIR